MCYTREERPGTRFANAGPGHRSGHAQARPSERNRWSGAATSDRRERWRKCSHCRASAQMLGRLATVVRAHKVGLTRAGSRERRKREAMTGNSPGRSISSVTTRPGARREETTQQKGAARRANTGLPVADREDHLHVHRQEDSRSGSRERAPERRAGAAGCLGPAATSGGRGAVTSTLNWHTFTPSGPMSASPSSNDARLSSKQLRRSQSSRARATSPAFWRPRVQAHTHAEATAVRGAGRSESGSQHG